MIFRIWSSRKKIFKNVSVQNSVLDTIDALLNVMADKAAKNGSNDFPELI